MVASNALLFFLELWTLAGTGVALSAEEDGSKDEEVSSNVASLISLGSPAESFIQESLSNGRDE